MAEIINLNRARKARKQMEDQSKAAENRVKFGRTAAEKAQDRFDAERREQAADQLRLDGDPD